MENLENEIKDSLRILNSLNNKITLCFESFHEMFGSEPLRSSFKTRKYYEHALGALHSMMLINFCSFIDEWEKQFIKIDNPRIRDLDKKLEPAFAFVKSKWPGLKNFRNRYLAHNLRKEIKSSNSRNKQYKPILLDEDFNDFKTPNNHNELLLIKEITRVIMNNVIGEFEELHKKAIKEAKDYHIDNPFPKSDYTNEQMSFDFKNILIHLGE